ncbi:MAG: DUF4175 family protein [Owenweeksia sp.]|nr:DUF4175 family protein [Owenweeksia sp.]
MQNTDALRKKLEVFIRKYYQNRLIKGLIYAVGLGLSYLFLLALAEYIGRFPGGTRLVLFVLLLVGLVIILGYYILYPLFKLMHIGKRISYERAAQIIGKHFPDVDDKLINTLQLQRVSAGDKALLQASVEQRIKQLQPVPFQLAINFSENKKYWPILGIPILVFSIVGLSGLWEDFSDSGRRIASFDREFVPEAPFDFIISNEDLTVQQGEDLELELSFSGSSLPRNVSLMLPSGESRMTRNAKGNFEYSFTNLQAGFDFHFSAAGYRSGLYRLKVLPVPQVSAFTLKVVPPSYTGISAFETEAKLVQDVPEGSIVKWSLDVAQANEAQLHLDTNVQKFKKIGSTRFEAEHQLRRDAGYSIITSNEQVKKTSIGKNQLEIIPDQYPRINIDFSSDTSYGEVVYYSGSISDDYGFSALNLVIESGEKKSRTRLEINAGSISQQIGAALVLDSLVDSDSKDVKLYLVVSDNDGVNGPKSRRSNVYRVHLLGDEERNEKLEEQYKNFFGSSEQNQMKREQMEKTLEQMQNELRDKKSLSWKDKNKIKELLNKQQELLRKQEENRKRLEKLQREEEKAHGQA